MTSPKPSFFFAQPASVLAEIAGVDELAEEPCESCLGGKAEIIQVTGSYCLQCWQKETHPDV